MKFHLHINDVFRKASGVANCIIRGTICRSPDFMVRVFISHIRPIIDFGSVVWNTGYVGDLCLLESVQRKWTKKIEGFSNYSYDERLSRLNLFSIKGRLLRADMIVVWKILSGSSPHLSELFHFLPYNRTRGHSLRLFLTQYETDVRSRFFSIRVINLWNSLPGNVVSAGTLNTFKKRLEQFLGPILFEFC